MLEGDQSGFAFQRTCHGVEGDHRSAAIHEGFHAGRVGREACDAVDSIGFDDEGFGVIAKYLECQFAEAFWWGGQNGPQFPQGGLTYAASLVGCPHEDDAAHLGNGLEEEEVAHFLPSIRTEFQFVEISRAEMVPNLIAAVDSLQPAE